LFSTLKANHESANVLYQSGFIDSRDDSYASREMLSCSAEFPFGAAANSMAAKDTGNNEVGEMP
jgi:hypothetical protein